MWTPLFISMMSIVQASDDGAPQSPRGGLAAAFERASKEPDLDAAGLILSKALSDESVLRSAYAASKDLDQRSTYILFGGNWGSRAEISWKERTRRREILIESISAKPVLIRLALRADRYATYQGKRHPRGAATINYFAFFSYSPHADDLVESFIESLRRKVPHPAGAIKSPFGSTVLVSADEAELNLLETWQLVCGVCDRLDLIDKATTKNWRDRFPDLDKWFQENRPYILWDDSKSCIRLDEDAKELGSPTPRESRSIPELKPSWRFGDEPKEPETS